MPIEIRELVIKASISESSEAEGPPRERPSQDRDTIIADCVEQVMTLLREQHER